MKYSPILDRETTKANGRFKDIYAEIKKIKENHFYHNCISFVNISLKLHAVDQGH